MPINRFIAAQTIMGLHGKGESIPADVLESAARIQSGTGSDGDIRKMGNWLRRRPGTVKSAKGALGKLKRVGTSLFNISRDVDLLTSAQASGKDTAIAMGRLAHTITTEIGNFSKSKTGRDLAKRAAEYLVNDRQAGVRFAKMIGKFARAGGVAIGAASAGAELGLRFFDTAAQREANRGFRFDIARKHDIEQSYITAQAKRAEAEAEIMTDATEYALNKLGLSNSIQDEVKRRTEAAAARRATARKNYRTLIGEKGVEALSAYAAAQGKGLDQLQSFEINRVLDDAINREIDPDRFLYSSEVEARLALQAPADRFRDRFIRTEAQMMAKRRQIAEEIIEKKIAANEQQNLDRVDSAKRMRMNRSPKQAAENLLKQQQSSAAWNGHRSRHQAWANK